MNITYTCLVNIVLLFFLLKIVSLHYISSGHCQLKIKKTRVSEGYRMKKAYKKTKYKKWHDRRCQKLNEEHSLKEQNISNGSTKSHRFQIDIKPPVVAPSDLRVLENIDECLSFFRLLRNENNLSIGRRHNFITISLTNVQYIDYASISILTALSDDLRDREIILRGNFPINVEAKQFIVESGFLNHMYKEDGSRFPTTTKSELIFFEKGSKKLSNLESIKIGELCKDVVQYLTNERIHCKRLRSIILEICGNSIEWGGTGHKRWLLGVQYAENKVVFTMTDVGKGILSTLRKKFTTKLTDIFTRKPSDRILMGAFEKKYSSSTGEDNRNKGLPDIKKSFEEGIIESFKVLTNDVILHFDDDSRSQTFARGKSRFSGTFYQWEMTKKCLIKHREL